MIQNKYQDPKFDNIEEFYDKVVNGMDKYFMKVLFCRALLVVAKSLVSFRSIHTSFNKKGSKTEEINSYFHVFLDIAYQNQIFFWSAKSYLNEPSSAIDKKTAKDMSSIMTKTHKKYLHHLTEDKDPTKSIRRIIRYLKDPRFHRDSDDYHLDEKVTTDCRELLHEIGNINVYLIHMIEIKKYSNNFKYSLFNVETI